MCLLLRNDKLEQGFLKAFVENRGFVGEGLQVILFEAIEEVGDELPFAVSGHIGLTQEITNHDVSLPEGYHVTLLKCLWVFLPIWAAQRLRTVACASVSIMSLSKARNDGVNINCFMLLLI